MRILIATLTVIGIGLLVTPPAKACGWHWDWAQPTYYDYGYDPYPRYYHPRARRYVVRYYWW